MKKLLAISFFTFSFSLLTYSQTISTYAGDGTSGHTGDGGQATNAEIYNPYYMSSDKFGNIYFVDATNCWLRMVNASTGIITTLAGTGSAGFNGDNISATSAALSNPLGSAVDTAGNIFISDQGNNRIRMIGATSGIITTVAGNGVASFSGDGGQATSAEMYYPSGLSLDPAGNIYISDAVNCRVRKVTKSTGIITSIAGNGTSGYSGDGGQATAAEIAQPFGNIADASGNVYLADGENNVVRRIDASSGIITTFAGNTIAAYSGDGGPATNAELSFDYNVTLDQFGNLYIADASNAVVRSVNIASGIINTVAGNHVPGYSGDGGSATSAELDNPFAVTIDPSGNLFIADIGESRVRKVNGIATNTESPVIREDFTAYPNPTTGKFIIQWSAAGSYPDSYWESVGVYNILGEKVYSQSNIRNPAFNIDLSSQPNGIYFYKVISETKTQLSTGKLIIQR